jgi:hypothetical protein
MNIPVLDENPRLEQKLSSETKIPVRDKIPCPGRKIPYPGRKFPDKVKKSVCDENPGPAIRDENSRSGMKTPVRDETSKKTPICDENSRPGQISRSVTKMPLPGFASPSGTKIPARHKNRRLGRKPRRLGRQSSSGTKFPFWDEKLLIPVRDENPGP